jgi:hypothetical protein
MLDGRASARDVTALAVLVHSIAEACIKDSEVIAANACRPKNRAFLTRHATSVEPEPAPLERVVLQAGSSWRSAAGPHGLTHFLIDAAPPQSNGTRRSPQKGQPVLAAIASRGAPDEGGVSSRKQAQPRAEKSRRPT